MQEVWAQSLRWEGPPEEEMATHSSILAWKIPWTEEPERLQSMGATKSQSWLSDKANTHSTPATTGLIQAYTSAVTGALLRLEPTIHPQVTATVISRNV